MTTKAGACKLGDFGVTGEITRETQKRHTVIGSPYWMVRKRNVLFFFFFCFYPVFEIGARSYS